MIESNLLKNIEKKHIHFVGIKGTGMTALVEICHARKAIITGSDIDDVFYTDEILKRYNIIPLAFDKKNITSDIQIVIYSAAYKLDENPDLIEAQKKNIPCLLYSEGLGNISKNSYSCAIAGVHGKTTTTGIVGTIIKNIELEAQVLAGSVIRTFNNSCTINYGEKYFIAETCEYKKHFMSFHPQKILLTSVESDHQDFYPMYESIRDAFVDFICRLPQNGQLIYCADDRGATETANLAKKKRTDIDLIPYGEHEMSVYKLSFNKTENEKQLFSVNTTDYELCVPGKHNVRNTCGCIALVSELLKLEQNHIAVDTMTKKIQKGVAEFVGSRRRCEIIGSKNNVLFIDDYAHHPTAIKTTLAGLKAFYPSRRLIVDFMAHTYSRTAALLQEFGTAFSDADILILHKIYASAREHYTGGVNGEMLFGEVKKNHQNVVYFEEFAEAKNFIQPKLQDNDLFITLGAGDNWKLGKDLYTSI
ncbi:MAG: UDP-N-acetylmuramate--L-alanine ligase [Treponemataceae bacterium]